MLTFLQLTLSPEIVYFQKPQKDIHWAFFPPSKECSRGERQLDVLGSLKNFKNLSHLHQAWKMLTVEEHCKQEKI